MAQSFSSQVICSIGKVVGMGGVQPESGVASSAQAKSKPETLPGEAYKQNRHWESRKQKLKTKR
jgi:hypothetical protein